MSSAVRTELVRLFHLAWPVALAQLAAMSMSVVDTAMVGHYDRDAMAAVAIGGTWSMLVLMFGFGAIRVMDPIIAQAHGARDEAAMGLGLARGVGLALALSVPSVTALWFAGPALTALGQPAELIPTAAAYCRAVVLSHPGFLLFSALRAYLQGREIMRPATIALVLANFVNAAVNWVLIYGNLGFPELGAVGAGVATSVSNAFQTSMLVALGWSAIRPAWPGLREALRPGPVWSLFRMGWPLGIQLATEGAAFSVSGFMVGWLGALPLAGHQITLNLASLSFMVPLGVSTAAATRVGNLIGAGREWALTAWLALGLGAGVMAVSATLFALLPGPLTRIYTDDPEVAAVTATLLPLAAAFQLFDGTQVVAFGVLRGAGDTRVPSLANVVGYWVLGIPLGWWLAFPGGLGAQGMWIGLALGLASVASLLVLRVRRITRTGGLRVAMEA